jgi:hypothetical protein
MSDTQSTTTGQTDPSTPGGVAQIQALYHADGPRRSVLSPLDAAQGGRADEESTREIGSLGLAAREATLAWLEAVNSAAHAVTRTLGPAIQAAREFTARVEYAVVAVDSVVADLVHDRVTFARGTTTGRIIEQVTPPSGGNAVLGNYWTDTTVDEETGVSELVPHLFDPSVDRWVPIADLTDEFVIERAHQLRSEATEPTDGGQEAADSPAETPPSSVTGGHDVAPAPAEVDVQAEAVVHNENGEEVER